VQLKGGEREAAIDVIIGKRLRPQPLLPEKGGGVHMSHGRGENERNSERRAAEEKDIFKREEKELVVIHGTKSLAALSGKEKRKKKSTSA